MAAPYQERRPPYSVGWIYIYPKVGKLVSIPVSCPLDYVIFYDAYAAKGNNGTCLLMTIDLIQCIGTVYEHIESCGDAVASMLVKGDTEEQMKDRIEKVNNTITLCRSPLTLYDQRPVHGLTRTQSGSKWKNKINAMFSHSLLSHIKLSCLVLLIPH